MHMHVGGQCTFLDFALAILPKLVFLCIGIIIAYPVHISLNSSYCLRVCSDLVVFLLVRRRLCPPHLPLRSDGCWVLGHERPVVRPQVQRLRQIDVRSLTPRHTNNSTWPHAISRPPVGPCIPNYITSYPALSHDKLLFCTYFMVMICVPSCNWLRRKHFGGSTTVLWFIDGFAISCGIGHVQSNW